MKLTVGWKNPALDQLADLWMNSISKQDITDASNEIDQLLSNDPKGASTLVSEGRWRLIVPPLGVDYHVSDEDCKVTVVEVWLAGSDETP